MINKLTSLLQLSRQREKEGHLSLGRQLIEMLSLRLMRGVGPGYYHTAGFWHKDIPWADKTSHLNANEYRKVLARLNPYEYRKITQHKIAEKAMLSLFSIPTPRFLGQLSSGRGIDHSGRPLRSASELEVLIRSANADRLVFKELEGYGGKGVRVVQVQSGSPMRCAPLGKTTEMMSLDRFCDTQLQLSTGLEWLVEEYFSQHLTLAAINPSSVNTVRIWVLMRTDSQRDVITAYLRIGRQNMLVDNASSGGIVAPIDLSSGVLSAAQDATAERRQYPRHPDHGGQISGVVVPHWPQVQELARKALGLFPHMRFAGLDVAVGADGPVILELNVSPDREGAAFTGCPNAKLIT